MILEEIKYKTAENHRRLEESELLKPITSPTLTQDHYQKILRVFYGYFYPLETALEPFQLADNYLPDYGSRRKAAMIRQDLHTLQHNAPEDTLPLCAELPSIQSMAQAFGCLYVMEGSTLGGKIIAKSLEKNLGLSAVHGASFFHGYGPDTGHKWKTFQQSLVRFNQDFQKEQEIVEAANETFYYFENWIRKN